MITSAQYGYEYRGLSSDNKDDIANTFRDGQIPNGASFFEMDTSKVYMYNAESHTWVEI